MKVEQAEIYSDERLDKALLRWANYFLRPSEMTVKDLALDWTDGVALCTLTSIIFNIPVKHNKNPKNKWDRMDNIQIALSSMRSVLGNINQYVVTDLADGDRDSIVELLLMFVKRQQVLASVQNAVIKKSNLSDQKALGMMSAWLNTRLKNCGLELSSWDTGWRDGKILCALIHDHFPQLLDMDAVLKLGHVERVEKALQAAMLCGVPELLDASDIADRNADHLAMLVLVAFMHKMFTTGESEQLLRNEGLLEPPRPPTPPPEKGNAVAQAVRPASPQIEEKKPEKVEPRYDPAVIELYRIMTEDYRTLATENEALAAKIAYARQASKDDIARLKEKVLRMRLEWEEERAALQKRKEAVASQLEELRAKAHELEEINRVIIPHEKLASLQAHCRGYLIRHEYADSIQMANCEEARVEVERIKSFRLETLRQSEEKMVKIILIQRYVRRFMGRIRRAAEANKRKREKLLLQLLDLQRELSKCTKHMVKATVAEMKPEKPTLDLVEKAGSVRRSQSTNLPRAKERPNSDHGDAFASMALAVEKFSRAHDDFTDALEKHLKGPTALADVPELFLQRLEHMQRVSSDYARLVYCALLADHDSRHLDQPNNTDQFSVFGDESEVSKPLNLMRGYLKILKGLHDSADAKLKPQLMGALTQTLKMVRQIDSDVQQETTKNQLIAIQHSLALDEDKAGPIVQHRRVVMDQSNVAEVASSDVRWRRCFMFNDMIILGKKKERMFQSSRNAAYRETGRIAVNNNTTWTTPNTKPIDKGQPLYPVTVKTGDQQLTVAMKQVEERDKWIGALDDAIYRARYSPDREITQPVYQNQVYAITLGAGRESPDKLQWVRAHMVITEQDWAYSRIAPPHEEAGSSGLVHSVPLAAITSAYSYRTHPAAIEAILAVVRPPPGLWLNPSADLPRYKDSIYPPLGRPMVGSIFPKTEVSADGSGTKPDLDASQIGAVRHTAEAVLFGLIALSGESRIKVAKPIHAGGPITPPQPEGLFGLDLQQTQDRTKETSVPQFLDNAMAFIENYGLDQEGVFRVPGNQRRVNKLRENVDARKYEISKEEFQVNDVTTALKMYFRELPNPLLTSAYYRDFLAIQKLPEALQLRGLQVLLFLLPPMHLAVLARLFALLDKIIAHRAKNQMDPKNLAVCLGPSILTDAPAPPPTQTPGVGQARDDVESTNAVVAIVTTMIEKRMELFLLPPDLTVLLNWFDKKGKTRRGEMMLSVQKEAPQDCNDIIVVEGAGTTTVVCTMQRYDQWMRHLNMFTP
eukprot:comp24267_c1_seq1/m.45222 comp24267_c1_seq1/g.45222  ORF comp24267_c1_seq1/g.45222 comp24267_c1_seq1/m.45222 type:complete len:1267 (-) comp24267_c1_seq1:525-4325(-)